MKVITRDEAHAQGLRKYYTGTPCKRNHYAERYVVSGGCCACMNGRYKIGPRIGNVVTHDLVAFQHRDLWILASLTEEERKRQELYIQNCLFVFARSTGKMTPELERSAAQQLVITEQLLRR